MMMKWLCERLVLVIDASEMNHLITSVIPELSGILLINLYLELANLVNPRESAIEELGPTVWASY